MNMINFIHFFKSIIKKFLPFEIAELYADLNSGKAGNITITLRFFIYPTEVQGIVSCIGSHLPIEFAELDDESFDLRIGGGNNNNSTMFYTFSNKNKGQMDPITEVIIHFKNQRKLIDLSINNFRLKYVKII